MTRAPAKHRFAHDADGLIARYYDKVFNLAFRTLGRREDAEDIAQQTFLRALPRLDGLRAPDAAGAWLCRIATNLCLDLLRSRQSAGICVDGDGADCTPLPDPDRLAAPAQAAELHEERVAVWRATLELPPEQRLALALREMHGMSYAQIAEAMSKSVAAVETLLFRARVGFRQAFPSASLHTDGPCGSTLELLSASIDGELDRAEQARIDVHVRTCRSCEFAACELRATSRLYALIPMVMPPAAKVTIASLLAGSVGGAAAGSAVISTSTVAPALATSGVAATAASGVWSSVGASAVGATVAAVIAVTTVSNTPPPVAAMSPPPQVSPTTIVVSRSEWRFESLESPTSRPAAQANASRAAVSKDAAERSQAVPAATPRPAEPPPPTATPQPAEPPSPTPQMDDPTPESSESAPESKSGAAHDADEGREAKDLVESKAPTRSPVAEGPQSPATRRAAKPTPMAARADDRAHSTVQSDGGSEADDKGKGTDKGDANANANANANGNGLTKGSSNADDAQGGQTSADTAGPQAIGRAAKGDPDESTPEPKAKSAGSPEGATGANKAQQGGPTPKATAVAPPTSEPKGNAADPPQGKSASNGNGTTQRTAAAQPTSEPKSNGGGSAQGKGASNAPSATSAPTSAPVKQNGQPPTPTPTPGAARSQGPKDKPSPASGGTPPRPASPTATPSQVRAASRG